MGGMLVVGVGGRDAEATWEREEARGGDAKRGGGVRVVVVGELWLGGLAAVNLAEQMLLALPEELIGEFPPVWYYLPKTLVHQEDQQKATKISYRNKIQVNVAAKSKTNPN